MCCVLVMYTYGSSLFTHRLHVFCNACRGADKAAKDVLGQKPLDMLIRKGKVSDDELLMMLS